MAGVVYVGTDSAPVFVRFVHASAAMQEQTGPKYRIRM